MKSSLGAAVIVTPLYAPEHANNIVHFNFNDSVKIGTTKETKADMKGNIFIFIRIDFEYFRGIEF